MQLKKFIKHLNYIMGKHGGNIDVVMADSIPVVRPVFLKNYPNKRSVVITDER